MTGILKVIFSEFKKIKRDGGVLLILLLAPLFYSFFYPYPYEMEIIKKVPVAVIDEDKSDLSRKITRMLDATEEMAVTTQFPSMRSARDALYERKVNGIIYIPRNFYSDVLLGRRPAITLFSDGSYMLFYSETFASAMKVVLTTAAGVKIRQMTMAGVPPSAAMNLQSSASTVSYPLFNIKAGYATFVVPAVLALILQQLILVAMMLIQGRDYEQGESFPEGVNEIEALAGKFITYLVCFGIIGFYLIAVSMRFFSIPDFGNWVTTFIFMLPYGMSVVFLGLAAGYFVREREGGVLLIIITSIPLLFLSGISWPIWEMPQWVQYLRMLFPSNAGVMGLVMVRQMGAPLQSVLPSYINLWVLTFAYMILAIISIKFQMKRANLSRLGKNLIV